MEFGGDLSVGRLCAVGRHGFKPGRPAPGSRSEIFSTRPRGKQLCGSVRTVQAEKKHAMDGSEGGWACCGRCRGALDEAGVRIEPRGEMLQRDKESQASFGNDRNSQTHVPSLGDWLGPIDGIGTRHVNFDLS